MDLKKYREELFGYLNSFHAGDAATGLGLYVTRLLVKAFQGEIMVASGVANGTSFRVFLPGAAAFS